jgi:predicted transcriptional regulator
MPTKSIAVPDAVYERVQQIAAAEGMTVDQLATEAIERDLARRWLDRVGREGDLRRGDMSDAEVEVVVERTVRQEGRLPQVIDFAVVASLARGLLCPTP